MVRLVALYNTPDDPAAFDAHYRDTHLPIVRRYPGLSGLTTHRVDAVPGSRGTPFHRVTEMTFQTREALEAALASEAGRESARDLRNFAAAGVQLFIAEEDG